MSSLLQVSQPLANCGKPHQTTLIRCHSQLWKVGCLQLPLCQCLPASSCGSYLRFKQPEPESSLFPNCFQAVSIAICLAQCFQPWVKKIKTVRRRPESSFHRATSQFQPGPGFSLRRLRRWTVAAVSLDPAAIGALDHPDKPQVGIGPNRSESCSKRRTWIEQRCSVYRDAWSP